METVTLQRVETDDQGTFGKLFIKDRVFFSLELPWRENLPNVSCIPEGTYECIYTLSPRFNRKLFLVNGVPDRFGVRLHAANFAGDVNLGYRSQLNGCIALGEKIGTIDNQKAILLSAPSMRIFETLTEFKPFILEVTNV